MSVNFFQSTSLKNLSTDGWLLFTTRFIRLFAYGIVSVILVIYLAQIGLTKDEIGWLLTCTLLGDAVISLVLTTIADRMGRRRMLMVGAILMALAGTVFILTTNVYWLIIAATIGVISPSGSEVGPFLAIEQATLTEIIPNQLRTKIFAWYHLAGFSATALGALMSGVIIDTLQQGGMGLVDSSRTVIAFYALCGFVLWFLFGRLSARVEVFSSTDSRNFSALFKQKLGLTHSQGVVTRLSCLFALDAFAGGFILQSIVAYWFHIRFGVEPLMLGSIFLGANIFSAASGLAAARLAAKFGLINTMVFTHIPSNVLLILVPLMPNLPLAIGIFFLRCSISQMDVPTRQSYTMAVVRPEERSAAGGITNIARTLGTALAPLFVSQLLVNANSLSLIFFIAGGGKILYDVMIYFAFRSLKPPEEK